VEPTEPGTTGPPLADGPAAALVSPPRRRHPARIAVASLGAVALIAAAVGVIAAAGDDDPRRPLVLMPDGPSPVKGVPAGADISVGGGAPYRYRLGIAAPALGSDALVARLEAPDVDQTRVKAMASALGLDGAVSRTAGGGWQVGDGTVTLTLEPIPGSWSVSFTRDSAGGREPGSVPGSAGSGGSAGSVGSGTIDPDGSVRTGTIDPVGPPTPTTVATVPANLPGAADAERIARALLARMGVADNSWSATVEDAANDLVACAPEPCTPPNLVPTARFVVLHPVLESVAIDDISWQVEIGDRSAILAVFGTLTTVRTLDRYPLRSVDAVFADLVAGKGTSPGPVPMAPIAQDGAAPDQVIEPVTVTIDRVTLGFAVMPASENGVAVVDLVPTYVFSATVEGGGAIARELVAVEASVATPEPTTRDPATENTGSTTPLTGKPEPQPAPAGTPVSGEPLG
jgi:hypothetical protein